jgi:hypothetical protein
MMLVLLPFTVDEGVDVGGAKEEGLEVDDLSMFKFLLN